MSTGTGSAGRGRSMRRCNRATRFTVAGRRRRWWRCRSATGSAASDERWEVPWLKGLRRVPRDATWPRLMTVPHPQAAGSLGGEFVRWAERREGKDVALVAAAGRGPAARGRQAGELVWGTCCLTMARQLGKSWLLRELMLWRMHQGDRFGEPQDVIHTGKDLQVCQEVQRRAIAVGEGCSRASTR